MNQEEKTATVTISVPLTSDFNLEKAVCSHGLFMMAPNHWDPLSKSFIRPIRLNNNEQTSHTLHISQTSPHALTICVLDLDALSSQQELSLLSQVRRMLRLSVEEDIRIKEFHQVHEKAKERGFGRVFRSPTLFEDMVKCILLCNCQWSRTLRKESNRKLKRRKCSRKLSFSLLDADCAQNCESSDTINLHKNDSTSFNDRQLLEGTDNPFYKIGNFPSPRELASLDEKLLAKCCNLGYRASRIINLAREVLENRIDMIELENASITPVLSDYDKLFEKLRVINGFGPFTCANVLMCMGFYHVIPTDSETIRHLKQVHAKSSTIKTVQEDVEVMYGKYAPFQFLAYWSEVWYFYEEWFGNFCEMPRSHFKLITAANMRTKTKRNKWMKLSVESMHEEK